MITWTVRGNLKGKAGNEREHHMAKWRRQQGEKAATSGSALVQLRPSGLLELATLPRPVVVTLTRIGVRLMDDDNANAACAYVRDQVAEMLGVTDGPSDKRVSWKYGQRQGKRPGIEVKVESAEAL